MRNISLAALLLSAGWAQQPAARPADAQPALTAEQVIERSIEATGGREAREKMTSTVARGTVELTAQGLRSTMEFYAKTPNKRLVITKAEGVGEFKQGYDGQVGWSDNPVQGLRELSGEELARLRREATFNPEIKWRDLYRKVELVGKDKVGERETYVVRLTPLEGKPLTRYYDAQTFLLLRQDLVQDTSQGPMAVTAIMSDYRDVNGIKAPFRIEQQLPVGKVIIKMVEVQNNVEIADAVFAKPAAPAK